MAARTCLLTQPCSGVGIRAACFPGAEGLSHWPSASATRSPPGLHRDCHAVQPASALGSGTGVGLKTRAGSVLWTPPSQALAEAGRSRQTSWVIEHMWLVYFVHETVTTLGGGIALLKRKFCPLPLHAGPCQLHRFVSSNENKQSACARSALGRRSQDIKMPQNLKQNVFKSSWSLLHWEAAYLTVLTLELEGKAVLM